ncbi:prenyltransferase [Oceanidesulfovibrio indonesiensis]|uniref:Prenyltransferase n=1 Tax=Oceanidesulfovibrio indonesiensis TaxID=54767 RepID=A0A7M3MHW1_9BACT|nr:prenyltransferase [Oceanidesulfovibrio indonesiensis]TVM18840.1 prenyltransferase [Oceanidesulfovibrio indonesiensis]
MTGHAAPSLARAWFKAARPLSLINLVFPLLMGLALAVQAHSSWSWPFFAGIMLYGWLQQLAIVFLNDYFDYEADSMNRMPTPFSGGSRVLQDGQLAPRRLLRAGLFATGLVLLLGVVLSLAGRPFMAVLFAGGLALLAAYSAPPIRLNYRGGGELLQGLGCGGLLPVIGFYGITGSLAHFPWLLLAPFVVLHTASSVATALPDAPADAMAGKRTLPAMIGPHRAGYVGLALAVFAVGVTPLCEPRMGVWSGVALGLALALLAIAFPRVHRMGNGSGSRRAFIIYIAAMHLACIAYALGFAADAFLIW